MILSQVFLHHYILELSAFLLSRTKNQHLQTKYRLLRHLQSTIKRAKEEISAVDAFNTQKQQAGMTLMNVQLAGFSQKSVALVGRWNKHWPSRGLSQCNGSS